MPNHESCKKRVRQSAKANTANRAMRSRIHTATKKVVTADAATAEVTLKEAYSVLDRAVKAGVIHKNKAANQKSRLAANAKAAATA